MNILQNGLELETVELPSGELLELGENEVESLDIVEEPGHMRMIPYVRATYADKSVLLVAACQCLGISTPAPKAAA